MSKKQNTKLLFSDIWPMERDYIIRPDRAKYLRRTVCFRRMCIL